MIVMVVVIVIELIVSSGQVQRNFLYPFYGSVYNFTAPNCRKRRSPFWD